MSRDRGNFAFLATCNLSELQVGPAGMFFAGLCSGALRPYCSGLSSSHFSFGTDAACCHSAYLVEIMVLKQVRSCLMTAPLVKDWLCHRFSTTSGA